VPLADGWPVAVVAVAALLAAVLTGLVRRFALRSGLLDVPNARSSHVRPTPRGGGAAIVATVLAGAVALAALDLDGGLLLLALVAGALPVALVGWLDDRRSLRASVRLLVHVLACAAALWLIGGLPVVGIGERLVHLGPAGAVIACVACVWFLNLFNFMDGIDGIAGAEAAFVALAAAAFSLVAGAPAAYVALWCAVAGASLGFLAWNWAPAKIFMGDVGSGFLGFVVAVLLVATVRVSALSVWTAIILVAPFAGDATATLLRRLGRREKWYAAHRSHAYQWLSRRFGSHARVTLLYSGVNVLLVLPVATWSWLEPRRAPGLAVGALAAAMLAAWAAGAGRPETRVAPEHHDTAELP
jgi:Fuc2NAc and GlcNAc transferase